MHFDLVDLRLISHLDDCNNLTRAAERSYLSLPAASARVKHLEESVGVRLLNRTSQGMTFTPAGQAFVAHARSVLMQLEHLRSDMQEYVKGIKGHLRIGANTTAMGEYLPTVLHRFLREHPDVNIDLREMSSQDIVRAVSDARIDIGIVAGQVRAQGLEIAPYRQDKLVLVVPQGHPLGSHASVSFAQTLEFEHVGLHEGSAIHSFLRDAANELGQRLKLRIQAGNFEAAARMIEAAAGIGVMPDSAARRHGKNLAIQSVALTDAWAVRELKVCVRARAALPAFANDLLTLLSQDAAIAAAADSLPVNQNDT